MRRSVFGVMVGCLYVRNGVTSSASGKAFFGMLAVFAQFERDILIERVNAGIARARAAGKHCGRPKGSRDIHHYGIQARKEAMQIDWMSGPELSEAIPPAYTEFIGRQLLSGPA